MLWLSANVLPSQAKLMVGRVVDNWPVQPGATGALRAKVQPADAPAAHVDLRCGFFPHRRPHGRRRVPGGQRSTADRYRGVPNEAANTT